MRSTLASLLFYGLVTIRWVKTNVTTPHVTPAPGIERILNGFNTPPSRLS